MVVSWVDINRRTWPEVNKKINWQLEILINAWQTLDSKRIQKRQLTNNFALYSKIYLDEIRPYVY